MTVELLVLNINLIVHKLRRFYSHITVVSVKRKKPTFEKKKKKKKKKKQVSCYFLYLRAKYFNYGRFSI